MTGPVPPGGEELREARYARFHVRVYARNRRPETGEPVAVIAQTRREAISRAIDLGWNGHRDDARIYVDRIEDLDPRAAALAPEEARPE